ncbi:hypothetical protein [Streptomyces laurentii]|uniref:hypothetical protein n=1 Tax=Streptomyces laurentii TaxID=39478 RepID=UPI0033CB1CB6
MAVDILFADLSRARNPRDYMARKLQDFYRTSRATPDEIRALVDRVYIEGDHNNFPLAAPQDLPKLSEGQKKFLDGETALFQKLVDQLSPLIEGEEIRSGSDWATLLKADFHDYPAGTPVLVRETSQATIYYLYHLAQVTRDGRFTYVPNEPEPNEVRANQYEKQARIEALAIALWADLLLSVAKGLLGAVGGKVGSDLLNALFPGSQGIDVKKMLDDFSAIVAEANKVQTVSEQAGQVNGVLISNSEYYIPRKSKSTSKRELYETLLTYHNKLTSVIGTLQSKSAGVDYTKAGLPVCVLAISTHLATYQEMAFQDPNVSDPHESTNVDSIRIAAASNAAWVGAKADEIITDNLNARLAKISDVLNNPVCDGVGSGVVCKSRYFFTDDATGYRSGYYEQSGCKDDAQKRCADARAAYVENVRRQCQADERKKLDWAFESAEHWTSLKETPLPKTS